MREPYAFYPELLPPPESIVCFIVLSGEDPVSPAFLVEDD